MKKYILQLIAILILGSASAQTIPVLTNGYTTGTYKREQRIISKFKCATQKPNELQANMRTVGKCYVRSNAAKETTAEYTYTEISGIRREDGVVSDLGNPIEDKTVYAYKVIYDSDGRANYVQGRDAYMDAVIKDNLHDLSEGSYFMYFLHNKATRKLGDKWTTDMFSYPLTEHIPMDLTFSKVEKTPEGLTAARLDITGNVVLKDHTGLLLDEIYEMNMSGTISGYMHVDMKTNRIFRIKAVLTLNGDILKNGKNVPYEIEVKINEWEMDPVGL
jgi:hypothetical protein